MNSVITDDIDWAPEFVIEEVFDTFADYELSLTLFVTRKSDAIEQCFKYEKQKVCVHPDFFPTYLLGYLNCSPEKWQVYFLEQVKENISPKHLEWLSALPKSLEININGKYIAFFHGSPWDPLEEYIYPDSNKFDEFANLQWDYVFLGHTRYPMFKQAGSVHIVNPCSCGQPRDGDLRASAAVFDPENEQVFFIRESYDIQSTLKEARLAGVPSEVIKKLERGGKYDKG